MALPVQNLPMSPVLDHQIIAALQINPRVPWLRLAEILSADPTTLARRWSQLRERGWVWTTCFERYQPMGPGSVRAALVEITCESGRRSAVMDTLVTDPGVYAVHGTTGARDLVATVSADSVLGLDRLVQERIASQWGVTGVRTEFLPTVFVDGPGWRLRALSEAQEVAVRASLPQRSAPAAPTAQHRAVMEALNPDPRLSIQDVADRIGASTSTASRTVEAVLVANWAGFRTDLAHQQWGWEAEVQLHLRVDSGSLPLVVRTLRGSPDLRMCSSVTGPANLTAVFWVRQVSDLDALEQKILTTHPSTTVLDRWVVSRVAKRMGHVLDADGLHQRFIPFERHHQITG